MELMNAYGKFQKVIPSYKKSQRVTESHSESWGVKKWVKNMTHPSLKYGPPFRVLKGVTQVKGRPVQEVVEGLTLIAVYANQVGQVLG